jgi:hypothetical protein
MGVLLKLVCECAPITTRYRRVLKHCCILIVNSTSWLFRCSKNLKYLAFIFLVKFFFRQANIHIRWSYLYLYYWNHPLKDFKKFKKTSGEPSLYCA